MERMISKRNDPNPAHAFPMTLSRYDPPAHQFPSWPANHHPCRHRREPRRYVLHSVPRLPSAPPFVHRHRQPPHRHCRRCQLCSQGLVCRAARLRRQAIARGLVLSRSRSWAPSGPVFTSSRWRSGWVCRVSGGGYGGEDFGGRQLLGVTKQLVDEESVTGKEKNK